MMVVTMKFLSYGVTKWKISNLFRKSLNFPSGISSPKANVVNIFILINWYEKEY